MKVTVILCVFNSEKYIAQAIESILNQTYTRFDLLIVDDGSNIQFSGHIQQCGDGAVGVGFYFDSVADSLELFEQVFGFSQVSQHDWSWFSVNTS